jgi:two-component system alkaline phosphatase synthesis response regulator PhoP
MRQELIDASEYSENPEAFIAGAQWMERYLNPPSTDVHLSTDDYTVSFEGKKFLLPKKEFLLAKYLQKNMGRAVPREELLNKIWVGVCVEDRTIDVHIRKLRSKINIAPIRTVKGVGYIWDKKI